MRLSSGDVDAPEPDPDDVLARGDTTPTATPAARALKSSLCTPNLAAIGLLEGGESSELFVVDTDLGLVRCVTGV